MAKLEWDLGYNQGYAVGFEAGYEKGFAEGSSLGFNNGFSAALKESPASGEPPDPLWRLLGMLRAGLVRLVVGGPASQEALSLLRELNIEAETLNFD